MSGMWNLQQAAQALGVAAPANGTPVFQRVHSDSRTIAAGDLFVALKGEHFDGHQYLEQVFAQGAVGAIVESGHPALAGLPAGTSVLEVADPLAALGALAAAWRQQFSLPLIGLTGSSGKTTVKEMIAGVLRNAVGDDAVLATTGNLNNHIGVPLMLLRLRAQHQYAVIEMGMNHPGEIRYLSALSRPTVALVNNAGTAHIGHFGSSEGIALAKGEIFEGLLPGGVAIINGDDDYAPLWQSLNTNRPVQHFGLLDAAVSAHAVVLESLSSRFVLHSPQGSALVELPCPGLHNVRNALAASSACLAVGMTVEQVAAGLVRYAPIKGRLQQSRAACGALLIDDSYNANPDSMRAAIDVLALQDGDSHLVLGDFGEVDEVAERHAELGLYARGKGLAGLWAVGEGMRHAVDAYGAGAHWFASHAQLVAALRLALNAQSSVLVKGSRFMRMEQVVQALQANEEN